MKPIFIVGSPRTGTHWMRRILGEHRSIVSNPYESHIFPLILGPFLYARLPWNKSWRQVNKNFINSNLPHWINENKYYLLQKEIKSKPGKNTNKALELAKAILDSYYENHKNNNSIFLLEKSPNHIYYLDVIFKIYPDAQIIELRRHPIEVLKSLKTLMLKEEAWVPKSINQQIDIWIRAMKAGLKYEGKPYYKQVLTIEYENLLDEFDQTIETICKFLSIDFTVEQLNEVKNKFQRTGSGGNKGINPLSKGEYLYLKRKTSSLCVQLGYNFDYY